MELDPRTIVVGSLISATLLGGISLGFGLLRPSTRLIGNWGIATLVLAAGLLGLALRGHIPLWLSAGLGNTLIVSGIVLSKRALHVFVGNTPRDYLTWPLMAAFFLLMLYFSLVHDSNIVRTVLISGLAGWFAAQAALVLRRQAPEACRLSAGVTEYVFWGVALVNVVRIAGTILYPPPASLAHSPLNAAVFLFFAGFIIISTLSVMWIEIETLQADLVRSAQYDGLTGLKQRGTFLGDFESEASRSRRGGPAFSLALFDLDHFKRLNDEHGHPVGDQVLKAFAAVLRASIRKHDTAGRYGGEEFALLMPSTGKDTAAKVAERVRRELETRGITVDGKRVDVTVSAGVATYGQDGEDWDALLSAADSALYAAKGGGRNRIVAAGTGGS